MKKIVAMFLVAVLISGCNRMSDNVSPVLQSSNAPAPAPQSSNAPALAPQSSNASAPAPQSQPTIAVVSSISKLKLTGYILAFLFTAAVTVYAFREGYPTYVLQKIKHFWFWLSPPPKKIENSDLIEQLDKKSKMIEEANRQFASLINNFTELKNQVESSNRRVAQLEEEINVLSNDKSEANLQVKFLEEEKYQLEQKAKDYVDFLLFKQKDLEEQIQNGFKAYEDLNVKNGNLNARNEELKKQIERIRSTIRSTTLESLLFRNSEMTDRIKELEECTRKIFNVHSGESLDFEDQLLDFSKSCLEIFDNQLQQARAIFGKVNEK